MDLITLDDNNQGTSLIEGYDSLVWTERFNTIGDFQLTTGDVSRFMTLLPEQQVVSLTESNVPMIVETHRIDRKKGSGPVLTITGRSYESVCDRRVSVQSLTAGNSDWQVSVKTPSDAAYYIANRICVAGILDSADIFPASQLQFNTPSDYLASTGPTKIFSIPRGNLLSAMLTLLQTKGPADLTTSPITPAVVEHGIRAVRPNQSGTAITIEIYLGTDKSATVYFDATRNMLDDGSYLFSKVGMATTAYVIGASTNAKLNKTLSVPSGLDRRVILVDGSQSGINDINALRSQGLASLAEAKETAIFDGSINQDVTGSTYHYGVDYNLGDTVRLVGDYGLDELAIVTEYIRTQDNKGYHAYPTLTSIT